jgi:outer membrane protein
LALTVKNRVFVFCSIMLGASLAASAQTSAPTKVGIINIQQAIVSTAEGQKAAKELEDKSAPKKKELEKMQGDIASLREQLNKMSSVGSEEQKRKLMADIDQKTKSFNRQVEDAQAELDQDQNRVLNELGGRMLAVLDKYAKDNNYAVILDVSSQQTPVLFAANSIDVTRDVVDLYNKNVPPAGASAPPAGARPAPATGGAPATGAPATSTPVTPRPTAPAATKPAAPKPAPVK